ncbi:DUF488 family protein [Photobacterium leiognathi]|uniref:DUF488 family protein n=1 Tax=Photobacterium leiognathi TaxID=553611 RepID=UPI00273A47FC|nr:DUF488 family protein [Photobacterium leiognathi]
MKIFTIGFTKKNAETFFSFLQKENVKTLIDVRLNNASQLAGFAKKDDLRFFLKRDMWFRLCTCSRVSPYKRDTKCI